MRVLLMDTETTGLDFANDRVIEMAVQITNENFTNVEEAGGWFLWDASYPPITEQITEITGITLDDLLAGICTPEAAFKWLDVITKKYKPEMVVAYNAEFDEAMFKAEVVRGHFAIMEGIHHLMGIPWACAMKDLEMNYQEKCWKLSHLALERGITVNPSELHRAGDDVELMRKMLVASKQDARGLLAFRNLPWVYLKAKTRAPWEDGGKSNKLAKERGYNWETPKGDTKKFDKSWVKRVKEHLVETEIKESPFLVTVLKGE